MRKRIVYIIGGMIIFLILIAGGLAVFSPPARYFVLAVISGKHFETYKQLPSSMEPTIHSGQTVSVLSFTSDKPQFGDIVVYKPPTYSNALFLGRVIGLPGDTLQFTETTVTRNGILLKESYILTGNQGQQDPFNPSGNIVLQSNQYYLLGDNRLWSNDSRHFGPVSLSDIIGKVVYISG